jgi:large subunit ribosomal protein L7Ae
LQPTRDLSRFVLWPRYVRIQRQKKVLVERLKVPPAINQFFSPLDKSEAVPVFKLLAKYAPETEAQKKERLVKQAADKVAGGSGTSKPPAVVKYGLNHVTTLVEQKKAKLVVIASDVEPIELVVWLPALCRKMGVPYVIVNNKGRLGQVVHKKKAAVVAIVDVNGEDKAALDKVRENAMARFNDNVTLRKKWGGGKMGLKTERFLEKRAKAVAAEAAKKALY